MPARSLRDLTADASEYSVKPSQRALAEMVVLVLQQWQKFYKEYSLPVEIRKVIRASRRDYWDEYKRTHARRG